MSLTKRLGHNIRELRRRQTPAMSSATLAARAGCSTALVSRIETGAVAPSMGSLDALASALGVTVADLLDADGPTRRAEAAIARARTLLLLGRVPDLTAVTHACHDAGVGHEWRARGFALIASAVAPSAGASAAATSAEHSLALVGSVSPPVHGVLDRAKIEVAHAVGEVAWTRGDWATATRRWGNGLAVVAPVGDIEALWARASIARSLARAAPGTRTAANALTIAIETLVPIADPSAVASRLLTSLAGGNTPGASLALAIVGASQVAVADARARLALLVEGPSADVANRSDLPFGRHLT